MKVTYGTFSTRSYDAKDPEHVERSAKKYMNAQGSLRIPGSFSIILPKVKMYTMNQIGRANPCCLKTEYPGFRGQRV